MLSESVELDWKNYNYTTNNAFRKLHNDQKFTDVTLACEDNNKIEAHKVILHASSNFFSQILSYNGNPHPLIYLQGIQIEDLTLLKKFMYLGRATVPTNQLESFMKVSKLFLNSNTVSDVNEETTLEHEVFASAKSEQSVQMNNESVSANDNEHDIKYSRQSFHTAENVNDPEPIKGSHVDDNHDYDDRAYRRPDPNTLKKEHASQSDINQTKHAKKAKAILPIIYKQDKMRCPENKCKFTSMYDSRLRKHNKNIHGEKSCPTCKLVFAGSTVLSKHIQHKHTKLTCEFCSYTSNSLGKLGVHQRKHNGSMKYCDQCEYSFPTNGELRNHMESRHNTSEYICEKCDFKAHTSRMITFHDQKIHRGVRFSCELCDYKATKPVNLRAHQKSVHSKIRFECRFCKFGDSQMSRVKLHEQRNHSVSKEEAFKLEEIDS